MAEKFGMIDDDEIGDSPVSSKNPLVQVWIQNLAFNDFKFEVQTSCLTHLNSLAILPLIDNFESQTNQNFPSLRC